MRKIFTLTLIFFSLFAVQNAIAQSPEKLSYQAVVRNASDELVKDATVGVRITILKDTENGTEVYIETHSAATNNNGLFSIEIGSGTTTGDFSTIDWSAGPYFLKTDIDPAGATSYTISGTSELISVPYALYAKKAANGFSGNYSDLYNTPDLTGLVSVTSPQAGDLIVFKGGKWERLARGADGSILGVSVNNLEWKTLGTQIIQGYFQFVTYKSGSANPIAFGFINPDGTIASGSGNFTCSWTSNRYEITITGESYFWTSYTTIVTLASHDSTIGAYVRVGSVGGKMLVHIKK